MNREFNLPVLELPLNPGFKAWDLNYQQQSPWPFPMRVHRFTSCDGPDAHDHPFGIEVYIPLTGGGYIEQIFERDGSYEYVERLPGSSFYIPASRIHRVDRLLADVCWTIAITGPYEQEWRVWPVGELTG